MVSTGESLSPTNATQRYIYEERMRSPMSNHMTQAIIVGERQRNVL
jgi:hypothetical protein